MQRPTVTPAIRPVHPDWPHRRLDVGRLRRAGWRPVPFHEFVLKVHQRCNLACDYCYVYESPDQTWRDRPMLMPDHVRRAAVRAMARHVDEHGLTRARVVLHGGEPLLAGPDLLAGLAAELREAFPASCELSIGMQTNGIALTGPALERLAAAGIRIGVSVDGTPESHDGHRRFRSGAGSHTAVARGLRLLATSFRQAYAGVLCVVDATTDPIATYEALLQHDPPAIDLLLPHANWEHPPPGLGHLRQRPGTGNPPRDRLPAHAGPGATLTPYAGWLVSVFDRWYDAPRRETSIRLFEDLMALVLGGPGRSEQAGLSPVAVAVVESDGDIELVDALKSAYPGACATGLNVLRDPFDAALDHPGVVARQIGEEALGDECRRCPVRRICGGGHYAHRYRAVDGFRNPTVYCADMQALIAHITGRLAADLHDRNRSN